MKKTLSIITLFFLILFFQLETGFSQNLCISMNFVSKDSNDSIPYVQLVFKNHNIGASSDNKGFAILTIPEEMLNNLQNDTLIIHALSYKEKHISFNDLIKLKDSRILLETDPIVLPLFIVKSSEKELLLGKKRKPLLIGKSEFGLGNQQGKYFSNPEKTLGIIKEVSVYITNNGKFNAPFRVRVYSIDEDGNLTDILINNIIVVAKKPNNWCKIDLSEYSVSFPKNGAVVAIECINAGEQYYYGKNYGVSIGSIGSKIDNNFVYTFYNKLSEWKWMTGTEYYNSIGINENRVYVEFLIRIKVRF